MTDARPSGWEQKESATWCSNTHHWSDEHNDDHHLVAVYKVRDKEMNKERGKEKSCAMATSVVGGSDEQNDVSDGADPSWWRPLTECRPLYSTQQCTRTNDYKYKFKYNAKSNSTT